VSTDETPDDLVTTSAADLLPQEEGVPAPTGVALQSKGLELPTPGDRPAKKFFYAGMAFYLAFAVVLAMGIAKSEDLGIVEAIKGLLGLKASMTMFLLVVLGIGVFVTAAYMVWRDITRIANEEEDILFLLDHQEAPTLVLVGAERRAQLLRQGIHDPDPSEWGAVETVLDDRVRRFIARKSDRSVHFSPDELRTLAEQQTGRIGVNARFASALLLLLAVLGTFSGVKSALPELINAAQSAAGDLTAMVNALEEVAGAFGANSLALVAAIAVSLMSQGLTIGRRHYLERLERASECLYRGVGAAASNDPLADAMDALKGSAEVMSSTAGSIRNLESVVNDLSTTFRDSFQELTQQLQDLALQQERSMHEKTAQEFRELQITVQEMSQMVETVIRANTGMVESLGRQHQEARDTVAAAKLVFDSFDRGVEGVAALNEVATRAAGAVDGRLDELRQSSAEVVNRLEAAASSIARVQPNVQGLQEFLQEAVTKLSQRDKAAAEAWGKAAQEVTKKMGQMLKQAAADRSALAGGGGGASGDGRNPLMAGLLQGVGIAGVFAIVWGIVEVVTRTTGR